LGRKRNRDQGGAEPRQAEYQRAREGDAGQSRYFSERKELGQKLRSSIKS
jgi:hypothetical protein